MLSLFPAFHLGCCLKPKKQDKRQSMLKGDLGCVQICRTRESLTPGNFQGICFPRGILPSELGWRRHLRLPKLPPPFCNLLQADASVLLSCAGIWHWLLDLILKDLCQLHKRAHWWELPNPCRACFVNFSGVEHWILKGRSCVSCRAERRRAAKSAALCTLFLSKVIAELKALLTILIQSSILLVFPKNLA